MTKTELARPKILVCCCCGSLTAARQWWNRDGGYGICFSCANDAEKRETPEEMHENYGVCGTHYKV